MKPNTPTITKPVPQKDFLIGTMNPNALTQPLLQKKTINKSYEKIADLSAQLDTLKQQNQELQEKLDSMVNDEEPTPFCQFKRWEIDFQNRLKDRENELSAFSRFIDTFRTQASPTFVKVDAANLRRPEFDSICVSLLVANPEKFFFNKEDLVQVNTQLSCLIDQQTETLKLLTARLKLFTSYQHKFTVQMTLQSLENKEIPSSLAGAAPTRALELKTKRKMLSAELAVLIKARRELIAQRIAKKMKLRRHRNRVRMALKIQKVMRNYLRRIHFIKRNKAAIIIQKVWRGFIQRWHQKEAEKNFDDFDHEDSEGRKFRMIKITKHRINPDGEEQEYYEYEEEEINDELKNDYYSDYEEEEEEEDEEKTKEEGEKGNEEEGKEETKEGEDEGKEEAGEAKVETEEGKTETEEAKEETEEGKAEEGNNSKDAEESGGPETTPDQ